MFIRKDYTSLLRIRGERSACAGKRYTGTSDTMCPPGDCLKPRTVRRHSSCPKGRFHLNEIAFGGEIFAALR